MADPDPMIAERARVKALCNRIDARIKLYADREGCDFADLCTRTWGKLFKAIKIDGDQSPLRLFRDLDESRWRNQQGSPRGGQATKRQRFPTIAAVIRQLESEGLASLATFFAHACLRERALVGEAGARRLLEHASGEVANRVSDDGEIPLHAVFSVPVGEFNQARQNRLRSEVLRQRIDSVTPSARLAAMGTNAIDVLALFYAVPGHRTFREKLRGILKIVKYPPALLQDVADLLVMWRPGEFDGLTGEKVRRALRPSSLRARGHNFPNWNR